MFLQFHYYLGFKKVPDFIKYGTCTMFASTHWSSHVPGKFMSTQLIRTQ